MAATIANWSAPGINLLIIVKSMIFAFAMVSTQPNLLIFSSGQKMSFYKKQKAVQYVVLAMRVGYAILQWLWVMLLPVQKPWRHLEAERSMNPPSCANM